jgi:hypothetical protein
VVEIPFRRLSAPITRVLARLPVTPNQVTYGRTLLLFVVFWLLILGHWWALALAFVGYELFELLDMVDGDLARFTGTSSRFGEKLELVVDVPLTTAYGVLGAITAWTAYSLGGGWVPWVLFGSCAVGRALTLELRNQLDYEDALDLSRPTYFAICEGPISGWPLRAARPAYIWRTQFLLFGWLLHHPLASVGFPHTLTMALALTALLEQLPWMWMFVATLRGMRKDHVQGGRADG